ncbi:MAG: hypothetical protein ACI4UE_01320 [Candidatus Scatovivens sp.]
MIISIDIDAFNPIAEGVITITPDSNYSLNTSKNLNNNLVKYPYAGIETNPIVPILLILIIFLATFLLTIIVKMKKISK